MSNSGFSVVKQHIKTKKNLIDKNANLPKYNLPYFNFINSKKKEIIDIDDGLLLDLCESVENTTNKVYSISANNYDNSGIASRMDGRNSSVSSINSYQQKHSSGGQNTSYQYETKNSQGSSFNTSVKANVSTSLLLQ